MAIKITADGKIVTKGGLPSCACCGCSPNYTTIYVRAWYGDPIEIEDFTMSGSLNSGYFNAPETDSFLIWDDVEMEWNFSSCAYGNFSGGPDPCSPVGLFEEVQFLFEPWPPP